MTDTTFSFDATLPPLPVPTLEDTASRYLEGVEALLSAEEFEQAKADVADLLADGGTGRKLQSLLEERASGRANWLAGWWEKYAYLAYPDPIVINSSIGISCDARHAPGNQAERAAQLTAGALDFYLAIVNETLPPEIQRDGSAFDMSLLKRFFAATRMPGASGDRLINYAPSETGHIVVVRNNRFYDVQAINPDGTAVDAAVLMAQFASIIEAADAAGAAEPIGVLTADQRPDWAALRDYLAIRPANRRALDRIDRALFLVCLDAAAYPDGTSLAHAGLHGTKGARWHDKSLHLIVDRDGRFTLHGEHAPVDAGAWVPLIEKIGGPADPLPPLGDTRHVPQPRELAFEIDDKTRQGIARASDVFDRLVGNLDLTVQHFTDFGKDLIKTFKTGPDPFLQMAFQLAYWRLYNRLPKTYEAASTRMYQGGRTETIRSASPQALALVKAFDDPAVSGDEKAEMIRAAFAEHGKRGKEASAGQAVDRHLLGLKLIAMENGISELPALFTREIFNRGWELSTAQLPMKVGFVNHFGPVCDNGYGIGYIIKPDHVNLNVTSRHSHPDTDSVKYAEAIQQAMRDLRFTMEAVAAAA